MPRVPARRWPPRRFQAPTTPQEGLLKALLVSQGNQITSQKALLVSQEGQIPDRFTMAEQLGATDLRGNPKLEVRLGGIYSLERIANDSEKDHWAIMEVLGSYARLHAPIQQKQLYQAKQTPTEQSG